ncbi:MAG TPA: phosphoribosylformylglycinamidine synthase subunit PurS [Asticcacaulis sp.]|jgi:phosphoribosylformylglycinamidine synthase|uniref:phosphoribosylformylglycinamidine synthase subunit PurS n=1 Tax=Asticcacaulis sp. TaxID=1872648 RepID=UPI002CE83487|nr:phosphoribosylformylglycinamidine synthase subunit PurS [Asticcacaulis sp.]HTM81811.1 phosphoribosylformylglycinamidine synthase subunit PurS [Asticcacaulis sp.]HTN42132.1 phosphoribosylformylglycinamidine synthase subunit PurS [Asticcacaulis sp.]
MKAKVHVYLKPGVLDVQGKAVEGALHGLGWNGVSNVRVGKLLEFDLDGSDEAKAKDELKAMCEKLLANTVIESYKVEVA